MKVKECDKAFWSDNFAGVLSHNGEVKVAKSNIKAKILTDVTEANTVLVKSRLKSYVCRIHKDLKPLTFYIEKGDTAFVKFRRGEAWMVGFRKANYDDSKSEPTGDCECNTNWITLYDKMEWGE